MEQLDAATLTTATALLVAMVTGAVELVKRLFDRDYRAAVIIAVSALIGGLAGELFFTEQIGFALGIVVGLGASGVITVAQNISGTTSRTNAPFKR